MRISTANTADNVLNQLQRLSQQQARLQNQISTGQRVTQPGDDPAAVGRLVKAQAEQRTLAQYRSNADAALQYSRTSFSGLEDLKKLSDRAGELAVLGAGANGPQAMQAYAAELNQLVEQAATLGNTRFRNDYVFGGTAVDQPPFAFTRDANGQLSGATYVGDTGRLQVPIAEGATIEPMPSPDTSAGLADFMNRLVQLRDALSAGDGAAVQAVRPDLEASEDLLVASLSEHGAVQLRIEVGQTQQQARIDEIERLISSEADADLPATIVRLSQTTQAYEAALSSAASILRMSLLDHI
jgi:flagellar hook-associated protein 3 FlgL